MYKPLLWQILRAIIVIGAVVISYFIIQYAYYYLYPLLFAVLLAGLLNSPVTFLEKSMGFPRSVATFAIMGLLLCVMIAGLSILAAELVQGSIYLAEKLPAEFQTLVSHAEQWVQHTVLPLYQSLLSVFQGLDPGQQDAIMENLQNLASSVAETGASLLQNTLAGLPAFLSSLPGSVTSFLFFVLAAFFLTNDWNRMKDTLGRLLPGSARSSLKEVTRHLQKALTGFFKAQLILMSVTACLIFAGLLFLQVEHAFTIAILASALDLLPYIGTGIIFIPWVLYLFITGEYSLTIGLTILYMVVIVTRQLLEPKVLSGSIGLHPLAALIAIFIGLQVWGFAGLIIAPILLVVLQALYHAGALDPLWNFIKG